MNVAEQNILDKIKQLSPRQKAEVVNFIEFVSERRTEPAPLMQFLQARAASNVGIPDVRRRLAKIPGKMSDTVRALRDERG